MVIVMAAVEPVSLRPIQLAFVVNLARLLGLIQQFKQSHFSINVVLKKPPC
jgi:hypothetical protein